MICKRRSTNPKGTCPRLAVYRTTVASFDNRPALVQPASKPAPAKSTRRRHGRIQQLLLPQIRHPTPRRMLREHLGQLPRMRCARPITLPFGRQRQPGHHVGAGCDHALDGDGVRLDRGAARGVGDDGHVPAFAERLDHRHRDTDLGPQAGDDQLRAAGRLDRVDDLSVLPGVDEGPVDDRLAGKHIGDVGEDQAAALGDHARQDGGDAEGLGGLGERGRVVDHRMRIVAVEVGELVGLVIDQDEDRILGAEKRSQAVAKCHDGPQLS
jgi:hypothetical protein